MDMHTPPHVLSERTIPKAPQPASSGADVQNMNPPQDHLSLLLSAVAYVVTLIVVFGLAWLQIFCQIEAGGAP